MDTHHGLWLAMIAQLLLIGCGGGGGGGSDGNGDSPSNSPPPPQTSFAINISPQGPPPYTCLPPGATTQLVLQKLNSFWKSNVHACACDYDLLAMMCAHNGFVTPYGYGYIFYDRDFLQSIDTTSRSTLPADFFLAHEFAHNIQLALNLNPPGKLRELQADCLGGFYVGYQAKSGQINQTDLFQAFNFACSIGDPFISNWWDPTHGTCPERVAAMQTGFNGYFQGLLPGQACP